MAYSQESYAEELPRIGNGMENALTDPDITAAREKVGYDAQEMDVGKAKYDAANAAYVERDL